MRFKNGTMLLIVLLLFPALTACTNDHAQSSSPKEESYSSLVNSEESSSLGSMESSSEETIITEKPDEKNSVYISPSGNGDGTFNNPYSLEDGLNKLNNYKVFYLLEGVYNVSSTIRLKLSGSSNLKVRIFAYQDKPVTLDFGEAYSPNNQITNECHSSSKMGMVITGSYYHIKGIKITNAGSCGMRIYGNNNIIEDCVFERNGNTGLEICGDASKKIDLWPAYNTIKNCTSYGNYDWNRDTDKGEDADGFAAKLCVGDGNIFDGCIAYNNSDDGYDLFTKQTCGIIGAVKLINCIAYQNGYGMNGEELKNGNGFKLGGRAIEVDHECINCLALENKANGFTDNSNPGTLTFKNCTSYNNKSRNFSTASFKDSSNTYDATWTENGVSYGPIYNVPKSHNVYIDCFSYASGLADNYCGFAENCYFQASDKKGNYYYFTKEDVCNNRNGITGKTYSSGENPFINTKMPTDIENLHYLLRNNDYDMDIKLGDLFILTSKFNNLGYNGTTFGCSFS